MSVQRFDRSELKKPKRTREGFLRADAYLAREGIQKYRRADGSEQIEFRPPEEVFKQETLESFAMSPLTQDHPKTFVTTDNWRDVAVGTVGDTVVKDGAFVKASLLVTDAAAIKALESGDKRQVSCGYTCDLDATPGEWKGQHYDCVQRNIVGNHVALVTRGRAGPEVSVRLDSEQNAIAEDASDTKQCPECNGTGMVPKDMPVPKKKDEGEPDMVKMKIDGVEYEVSEQAKQALEREAGRTDAIRAEAKQAADVLAKRDAELAEMKKKLDAAEAAKAAAVDPEKMRSLVKARVALCSSVQPILGDKVKLDDLAEKDIMVLVLQKADKDFKPDGKSDEYLQGRFDEAVRLFKSKQVSPVERTRGAAVLAASHEDGDPLEKALAGYRKRNVGAWQSQAAEAE